MWTDVPSAIRAGKNVEHMRMKAAGKVALYYTNYFRREEYEMPLLQ
jgi:hypothetical protein